MKCLTQIWTGTLTLGLLTAAGASASANSNQVAGNDSYNWMKNPVMKIREPSFLQKKQADPENYQAKPKQCAVKSVSNPGQVNDSSVQNPQNQNQLTSMPIQSRSQWRFNHSQIYQLAQSKLSDPYMYGASGDNEFDCSGYTQYLYRRAKNITIPRTAQAQYDNERHVPYQNIKAGNLVFFGLSKNDISHVGMYIGNGKMIDAQNRGVVIENVLAPWWHLVGCAQIIKDAPLTY